MNLLMFTHARFAGLLLLVAAIASCQSPAGGGSQERARLAERFFRGVYGGDPRVVDELAAEDIVISYPIFEQLFGSPFIRGKRAVKDFAIRFGRKWANPEIQVEELVADGSRVVLVWTFEAREVGGTGSAPEATGAVHNWGGISVFRFDQADRIVAEFGEESEPGPVHRLRGTSR